VTEEEKIIAEANAKAAAEEAIAKAKAIAFAEKEEKLAKSKLDRIKETITSVEELASAEKDLLQAQLALSKANSENISKQEAIIAKIEAVTNATKAHKEALDDISKSQDSFGTNLESTITALTGLTSGNETLIGSWLNMGKASSKLTKEIKDLEDELEALDEDTDDYKNKTAELKGKTDALAKSKTNLTDKLETYAANLNPVASITSKVVQATFAAAIASDAATAAFNSSSGAAGAYDSELVQLELSNRQNGISTAELGESYGSLMSSLSGFGVMSESERMRLGELGAQFAKAGVAGADFAGTLQTMTRGFGMSTHAATRMQEEAMVLAQTLGKDVGQVLSEMNAALPQLASYGSDAVDMFFDLEKQSQRTGLAVGDLIGIAGNYRTFDSAAEAAGNLNAVLGTQLFSTMGLLEAQLEGPEKVLEYMTENLSNSIGDWDSLNTFQKDAVANAAGMNVEQMNNLMNQKNMTKQERDRAKSLEETMAAGRTMFEELKIAGMQFALAVQPLMQGIVFIFQKLNQFIAFMKEEFPNLAAGFSVAFATGGIIMFIAAMAKGVAALRSMWMGAVALQAVLGGPAGWAKLAAGVAVTAGVIGGLHSATKSRNSDSHARGTDRTSGRMALVGEEGPEGYVSPDGKTGGIVGANGPEFHTKMPQGSAIINNTTMTSLAKQATNRSVAGSGDGAAMAAAVASLKGALSEMSNRPIQVTTNPVMLKDDLGRGVNDHFGEPGSRPIRIRTA
jgi:hypothetical protein